MGKHSTYYIRHINKVSILFLIIMTNVCYGQVVLSPCKPVRSYNLSNSKALNDIESHLFSGHIYDTNDLVSCAHECTHGINSALRSIVGINNTYQALYTLNNTCVIIRSPRNLTLLNVSNFVPFSIRGEYYQQYLREQSRSWNDTPLYILDEWQAYSNSACVAIELGNLDRLDQTYIRCLYFMGYSLVLCKAVSVDSTYDDRQLKGYVLSHAKRVILDIGLLLNNQQLLTKQHRNFLLTLQRGRDTMELREFCYAYFGKDACKSVFGF